jgi:hypothetical protein
MKQPPPKPKRVYAKAGREELKGAGHMVKKLEADIVR